MGMRYLYLLRHLERQVALKLYELKHIFGQNLAVDQRITWEEAAAFLIEFGV